MPNHSTPCAVIFPETPHNRYSLAALTGILETDDRLRDVAVHFVPLVKQRRTLRVRTAACADEIEVLVRRYARTVIALSFPTASIIIFADLLRGLRERLATGIGECALLVAGGPHPSGDPAGTLRLGADIVASGEGEYTFPALLDGFFQKTSPDTIKGLWYADDSGEATYTGTPQAVDLSDFPPFAARHKRFCPIEISRGCPHGCRFCQTTFLMGGRMRHRSLESFARYAEMPLQLGMKVLRFITPSAFAYGSPDGRQVNLEAVAQLLRVGAQMYGRDEVYFGSFPSEVRPEQVSPDMLDLVTRYCANTNLLIGAQSGSDRMLRALHREHTVDDIVRAVDLTLNAGLTPNVDLIFGLPGETEGDRRQTLALIERFTRRGVRVQSHAFMPLPGTPLAHCPPGVLDDDIRALILSLQGKQLAGGRWQQHECIGQRTTEFLNIPATLNAKRKTRRR